MLHAIGTFHHNHNYLLLILPSCFEPWWMYGPPISPRRCFFNPQPLVFEEHVHMLFSFQSLTLGGAQVSESALLRFVQIHSPFAEEEINIRKGTCREI